MVPLVRLYAVMRFSGITPAVIRSHQVTSSRQICSVLAFVNSKAGKHDLRTCHTHPAKNLGPLTPQPEGPTILLMRKSFPSIPTMCIPDTSTCLPSSYNRDLFVERYLMITVAIFWNFFIRQHSSTLSVHLNLKQGPKPQTLGSGLKLGFLLWLRGLGFARGSSTLV